MADKSHIEWTDATWNPIAGCSIVSPGCTNCYAMRRVAPRLSANPATPHYAQTVQPSKAGPVWTGKIGVAADKVLMKPLAWTRPRKIFVTSASDLFHEGVPDEVIDRVFAVMALCPQHTFQVLTKRPERMRDYLLSRNGMGNDEICRAINTIPYPLGNRSGALEMPLPNVWLGVSVEDQPRADERIPLLLDTPAAVRWISGEPMLGSIDLARWLATANVTCKACKQAFWLHEADPCKHQDQGTGWTLACPHCNGCRCRPGWTEMDARLPGPMGPPEDWIGRITGRFTNVHPSIDVKSGLDWVVCGGESGNDARPMHPDWARSLRDQCAASAVPFLFKQWGNCLPGDMSGEGEHGGPAWIVEDEHFVGNWDDLGKGTEITAHGRDFIRFGSARHTGRTLDGVMHDAYPEQRS